MKLTGVTSVLVAAKDQDLHNQVARVLKSIAAENIASTDSAADALAFLTKEQFHLAIVDQKMQRLQGINLIQEIRSTPDPRIANLPILVIVGTMTKQEITLLQETPFIIAVKKPFADLLLATKIFEVMTSGDVSTAHSRIDSMDYSQFTRVVSEAIRNNRLSLAEEFIARRLANNDKSPRLLCLVAQLRFSQGKIDEAFTAIEKILETNPDFLPALTMKAKIAVKLGLFDEAMQAMEYAQSLSPLNTQRLLAMGELHLGFGRHHAAVDKFKRALEIYPALERAKMGLARGLAELGDRQEAQKIIKTLSDPMAVVSELNLKGVLLAKSGRFREAAAIYRKALAVSSGAKSDAALHYNLALSFFKERMQREAEDSIIASVQLDPEFEKAARLRRRIMSKQYFPENEAFDADISECLLTDDQIQFLLGTTPTPVVDPNQGRVKTQDDVIDYEQLRSEHAEKTEREEAERKEKEAADKASA